MITHGRLLLLVGIFILGTAESILMDPSKASAQSSVPVQNTSQEPASVNPIFIREEIKEFLAIAIKSESITDPLRHCLAFPDPPGSHWSRATVEAYCRYRVQPIIGLADAQALIRDGHARKLDRLLAHALRVQRLNADSRGLLNRIYYGDFESASPDVRRSIDAWKRQSPRSAFAYVASGFAYVSAAGAARGSKRESLTSESNFDSMHTLLAHAKIDLDKAAALQPKLTPAYVAMIEVAILDGDAKYAEAAAKRGLAIDPSNYSILAQLMDLAKPKWGGSVEAMQTVADRAKAQLQNNPLLLLLISEPAAEAAGICGCTDVDSVDPAAYKIILDQIAAAPTLGAAGLNAEFDRLPPEVSVVYLSEALRFDPSPLKDRIALFEQLLSMMEIDNHSILHEELKHVSLAEADALVAMRVDDPRVLEKLAGLYASFEQWDKASNISDQLIQVHPDNLKGWLVRAMIQKGQPRPGLHDTDEYIVQHFSSDPNARYFVDQARHELSKERARH